MNLSDHAPVLRRGKGKQVFSVAPLYLVGLLSLANGTLFHGSKAIYFPRAQINYFAVLQRPSLTVL